MSRFIKDSERCGRKTLSVTISLLLLCLTLLAPMSYSLIKKELLTVSKVSVSIDGHLSEGTVDELITIKPGDSFSLKEINDSIKRIYRTELFSDISVIKAGQQNVELTFLLTSRLYTRHINFIGRREVPISKLKSKLSALREGSSFSDGRLERALAELEQQLREDGYFDTSITPSVNSVPGSSEVDILFDVGISRRFIVNSLVFIGELNLPEDQLRREMETEEGGMFVPSVLEEDISKLKELYASEDFRRAEIKIKERNFDAEKGLVSLSLEVIPREKCIWKSRFIIYSVFV